MKLDDNQLERYARHIILKEIGGDGQRKLGEATVVIIGAGGIGSPAIQYLSAAGIGWITLIDDDRVALSNLQRQTIYRKANIGELKVDAAVRNACDISDDVSFVTYNERLTAHNVERMFAGATVVIDGSDNFETRLIAADAAHKLRIPLISAAVDQFEGQLAIYRGWEADKPCYRCLVGDDPARPDVSCADRGVLGPLTGVMGSLAALEAIRAIVRFGEDPAGRLLIVDGLAFRFRTISLPKDPGCRCSTS